jgi:hypothetical protein
MTKREPFWSPQRTPRKQAKRPKLTRVEDMKAKRQPLSGREKLAERGMTFQDIHRINEARKARRRREAAVLGERMARDKDR